LFSGSRGRLCGPRNSEKRKLEMFDRKGIRIPSFLIQLSGETGEKKRDL